MGKLNFSEWLKSRFKDEVALASKPDEMEYLLKAHRSYLLDPEIPQAKDENGVEIRVGDKVIVDYLITGIHPVINPETLAVDPNVTILNLATIRADGSEQHAINLKSCEVTKVQ